MKARLMQLNDLPMVQKWWKDNRFPVLGTDDLPMVNGELQGIIVSYQGKSICAGFVINTTVKNGAMIEYIVADFYEKDRELRKKALNFLIKNLSDLCKRLGKKYAYSSLKNKSLIDRYEEFGFNKGSVGCTEMLVTF